MTKIHRRRCCFTHSQTGFIATFADKTLNPERFAIAAAEQEQGDRGAGGGNCSNGALRGQQSHCSLTAAALFHRHTHPISPAKNCLPSSSRPHARAQFHFHGRWRRANSSSVAAAVASQSEAAGVTESGTFSQSDEELASRGLSCHSTIDDLDLDQLNSLFSKVSFPQREKQKLLRALQNTQALTWVQETQTKRLIGFARATGDQVFHAIIWDVVVDPAYQGLGLGKVLMERLMADLVRMGISNIALYAEPTVVGFYQPLGFIADPDGIRAMAYSRRR